MNPLINKVVVSTAIVLVAAVASGCAAHSSDIVAGKELAQASSSSVVVFGKFRLERHGEEANISENLLQTSATLYVSPIGSRRDIAAKVNSDGEFAWVLEPGHYRVSGIRFNNKGERVESPTDFSFHVAQDQDAIYVGTLTMATRFWSGFYGINGTVDGYVVSNDCAFDCSERLQEFGMADGDMQIRLLQSPGQMASSH